LSRSLKNSELETVSGQKEEVVKSTNTIVLLVLALLTLGVGEAFAGGYLKVGDIKGESTDEAHQDWSDVLAWKWSMGRSQGSGGGSSRGGSRIEFGELVVTKKVDAASPVLMLKCADGSRLREATLDVPLEGDRGAMVRLILFNVQVASVQVSQTTDDGQPSEHISLNYTEVKVIYENEGGPIEFSWDIQRNRGL
jgi:type VI secretion system secreted protein Hcp